MKQILTGVKVKPEDLLGNIVGSDGVFWLVLELFENKKEYSWMYIKNHNNFELFKKNHGAITEMTLSNIEDGLSKLYIL